VCLVPEKRLELTTEGGLNVATMHKTLGEAIGKLTASGVRVSLFIEPSAEIAQLSKKIGAHAVEFHTGLYAKSFETASRGVGDLAKIKDAALAAKASGLLVNAGHGLNYENIEPLMQAYCFDEFNIGFAIVARALFVGMESAVGEMKRRLSANPCAAS
jgi:pyridoxine 5-phosphate synthase